MINRIIKKIPLASPEPTNEYLNLCQSGYEKCDSGYTYGPAVREFYIIHYVISGKGTLKTEDSFYQLSARQAFIIYPEEVTTYSADECEPWYYCFFAFSGSLAAELVERTEFRGRNRVVTLPDNNIFEIIDETTMTLKWARDNHDLYALSQLFRLIDIFATSPVNTVPPSIGTSKNYVKQAMDYIHFNYAADLSVSQLADKLALNRSYFYRIFKEEIGMSPLDYINNYRIERAKDLLRSSQLPIWEIASITGFNTLSSFYRMFLLKTSMSPREYRSGKDHSQ